MKRLSLFLALPLVIVTTGLYFYLASGRFIHTDNAYIRSHIALVSASVSGQVKQVWVQDNQQVQKGELLYALDMQPFDIAIDKALAMLDNSRIEISLLKTRFQRKSIQLAAAKVEQRYANSELLRVNELNNNSAVSKEKIAARKHALNIANNKISAAKADMNTALAQLGGNYDQPAENYPLVRQAQQALAQAQLDRRWATAKAGIPGTVVKLSLQPGEYIQKGQALFSVVQTDQLWIEANLKETQLTNLEVGQSASIQVDAFPGQVLTAQVSSIAPASGSEFAILPAQNATGNWVKVTQRIPIKLVFDHGQKLPQLRAGLSVTVSIDSHKQRHLADLLSFN